MVREDPFSSNEEPMADKQESVFELVSYQGSVNYNHTEVPSIASQNGSYRVNNSECR